MLASNKVIFNTGVLYIKIVLSVLISLFTTRIVLDVLGVLDYGIFNLVAGVIAMLSFLKNAMATSTQRYLSYYFGKKDNTMQRKIFWNSIILHSLLAIVVVVMLESVSLVLFNGFLNIPTDRVDVAIFIYHFMVVSVFFSIISIPFSGSLIAHENMIFVSVVSLLEVLLKLAISLFLYQWTGDKLYIYGVMMASISFFSFICYASYGLLKYPECKLYPDNNTDINLVKELGAYASWNLFGSLCSLGRTQGLAVILNLFFGAVINSAYAIANQVGGQLMFLSTTMLKAINPQIMKSEGSGDRSRMLRLSMIASKFGFFMLSIVAIPFIFEMENILGVWLKEVPEYASIFCKMVLVGSIINQLTIGLQSAIQATGKIKAYQATVGGILLLNLPLAYMLLKIGYEAYSVLMGYLIIELVACFLRLYFMNKLAGLSIRNYFNRVIFKEIIPMVVLMAICFISISIFEFKFRFLLTISASFVGTVIAIKFWGLCDDESDILYKGILKLKQKIFKKKEFAFK